VRVDWGNEQRRLTLAFDDEDALAAFHATLREQSGFMAPLPLELSLYSKIAIELTVGGESRLELEAEVAQAFALPSGDWNTAFLAASVPETLDASDKASDETETRGTAPIFRIQKMNPNEKARLATRAGREERQVLLRDNSPLVLQSLLANPRVQAKEVLRIVKSTHANAGLLKRIAEDPRWGKNQEILSSIAKNPKSPPPLAVRLIDRLRTSDLRMMGKMSSGLREDVRQAALREYLRRSGR
jgi:hypothetical protein